MREGEKDIEELHGEVEKLFDKYGSDSLKNTAQNRRDDDSEKKNLTQRFDDALKDNPKLTYNQIYKEMKVDTRSDDPDVYKEAEDRWLRKHGY